MKRAAGALLIALGLGAALRAEPAPTPRLSWIFDGPVYGVAQAGNVIAVGGWFSRVSPGSSAVGHLVALSTVTGASVSPMPTPGPDEIVTAIAPDSAGGYYFAGRFTNIGSGPIVRGENTRLAHVRGDGSLDTGFTPSVTEPIVSLTFAGPSLVVLNDVMAAPQRRVIVVDAATGQERPWTPQLPSADPRPLQAVATAGLVYLLWDDALMSHVTAFDGGNGAVAWTADLAGRVPPPVNYRIGLNLPGGAMVVAGGRLIVGLDRLAAIDRATGLVDPAWGAGQAGNALVFALRVHGAVVYVGGAFSSWAGQPRNSLAAVDLTTGALVPWAPMASADVYALEVSPDGTVFVGSPSEGATSIAGQPWTGIAALDPAGAVTAWKAQPLFTRVVTMAMSSTGTLIAGTSLVTMTSTARSNLATFDATTGALLPAIPAFGDPDDYVGDLLGVGATLFVSLHNGTGSGSLWAGDARGTTAPALVGNGLAMRFAGADANSVYVNHRFIPFAPRSRRVNLASLQFDDTWNSNGYEIVAASPRLIGMQGTSVAELDLVTGASRRSVTLPAAPEQVAVDGGTVYALTPGTTSPILMNTSAIDFGTGTAVSAPAVSGRIVTLAVADGRLFFGGSDISTASGARVGLVEVDRRGVATPWNPRFGQSGPFAPGIVTRVIPLGRQLAAIGSADIWNTRVAVFDLQGATAPSALRSTDAGSSLEFTWDPGVRTVPGSFVLEAGYGPGTTAAQVAVGSSTTFTAPGPIPGPVFVRVRDAATAELSNEIVVGCLAPAPPTTLTATVTPAGVALSWAPASRATSYTLAAGTTAHGREIGTLTLPAAQTSFATPAPPGTYFLRVRANNACGSSPESGEVFFTVGSGAATPTAPTNLVAAVSGSRVTLQWALQNVEEAREYVLEVGQGAGLADLGAFLIPRVIVSPTGSPRATFSAANVPPGTYYLRVRAVNAAGAGPPSADVVVTVP